MINLKTARKYVMIKYDHARKTGCDSGELTYWLKKNHKEILECTASCGFCEYTVQRGLFCQVGCPLSRAWKTNCPDPNSPWMRWIRATTKRTKKKWANKIYQDAKEPFPRIRRQQNDKHKRSSRKSIR